MKADRFLFSALLGGATVAALGCGDHAPLAVHSRASVPQAELPGWLPLPTGLLRCSPLPYDSVTATIGPEGGTLQVGLHSLSVPPGALDAPVSITAVAPSDTANRVRLQPEGLTFQRPASLALSYANCDLLGIEQPLPKRIAQTTDDLTILGFLPSVDEVASQTVTGQLRHFSDYAVAW
ncbi:MAG TPA: hypothetical protein VIW28_12510 [Gemmatimonadales bacterium]|jgi:hypothetical protein